MKIGELARQAGVDVQTVRYYEREGLLDAPARTRRATAPTARSTSSGSTSCATAARSTCRLPKFDG